MNLVSTFSLQDQLEALTRSPKTKAPKFIHARALLLCDTGPDGTGQPWKVADAAAALGVSSRTVEHLKERFVEEGLAAALTRKSPLKPRNLTFDGQFEARLTALACSPAPDGRARWTVRLASSATGTGSSSRKLHFPRTTARESARSMPPQTCRKWWTTC